jgi:mono/diheme cytochrome c family protein
MTPFGPEATALARGSKARSSRSVKGLYKMRCLKCHDANGKGNGMRDTLPEIPDFTRLKWHQKRSDAQLLASILSGKGKGMPAFDNKLSKKEAQSLVGYIRSFRPGRARTRPVREGDFDKQFQKLQEKFDRLMEQSRALQDKYQGRKQKRREVAR